MEPREPELLPGRITSLEGLAEERLAREARRQRILKVLLPVAVAAPAVIGWEWYAAALGNPLVPGPSRLVLALPEVLGNPQVWSGLANSNLSLLLGYLAAITMGVPLGLLLGRARVIDDAFGVLLNVALVTPMVVVMPVVLMALGLSRQSQAVIIFVFALPLVTVPCRAAAREIPRELTEMAHSFGAAELRMWREILIPGSIPGIAAGLRLGFGQAMTGMAVVELTLLAIGIGNVILDYQSSFRSAQSFDVIGLLIVEAVVAMSVLRVFEDRVAGQSRANLALEGALA